MTGGAERSAAWLTTGGPGWAGGGAARSAPRDRAPKKAEVFDAVCGGVVCGDAGCGGAGFSSCCGSVPFSHQGVANSRRCRLGNCGAAASAGTSVIPLDPGFRRGSRVTDGLGASGRPLLPAPLVVAASTAAACWPAASSAACTATTLARSVLGDDTPRSRRGAAPPSPTRTAGGRKASAVVALAVSFVAGPRR